MMYETLFATIHGFTLSLSLILVIGAQNAFILRQGLIGKYILPVVLLCAFSDAILILIGIYAVDFISSLFTELRPILILIGAGFLFGYGALKFFHAWVLPSTLEPAPENDDGSLKIVLTTALLITWLNPHVYLDTVFLIGAVAAAHQGFEGFFAIGAVSASFIFFFALGFGAKKLKPYLQTARAWKRLEIMIGIFMWTIAGQLIYQL